MSDPFAMFAEDVKAAVPTSPGEEAKEKSAFDTFAMNAQQNPAPQMPPTTEGTLVPMNSPANPYSVEPMSPGGVQTGNPFGAPVSPTPNPFGAPVSPNPNPFEVPMPMSPQVTDQPNMVSPMPQYPGAGGPPMDTAPPSSPPPAMPSSPPPMLPPEPPANQLVAQPPADPWGAPQPQQFAPQPAVPPAAAPPADPWGAPQQPPAQSPAQPPAQPPTDPWGAPHQPAQPPATADDPFSVFSGTPASAAMVPYEVPAPPAGAPPAEPSAAPASALPSEDDDMWAQMGFDPPAAPEVPASSGSEVNDDLPPDGEYYDVKIFTPSLGIMFFRPQQLKDSLFLETDKAIVDGLGNRPIVSHILEGSSARSANIELGHVLLKVNDTEVHTPEEAVRAIRDSPRPLPLLFYVPKTKVVTSEGEHMVKYDSMEWKAPPSASEWKKKYVVVGGIISKPHLINMYRSKEEYDVAVIQTQSEQKVTVKVKQFSLKGGRIYKEDAEHPEEAMQSVQYKKKLYPWKYFVIVPATARGPVIKISATTPELLEPVLNGTRRILKEVGSFLMPGAQRAVSPPRYAGATDMNPYSYDAQIQRVQSY